MARTECEVLIEAPKEFVWEQANDLASWTSLFSEYSQVDVIESGEGRYVFRLTMHPDETGKVWSWVSERVLHPESWTVSARRIEPGPFDHMNIQWYFDDTDLGTNMRWVQEFAMKPDAPVDNDQMARKIVTNSHIQMGRFKRIIEAEWKKQGTAADPVGVAGVVEAVGARG